MKKKLLFILPYLLSIMFLLSGISKIIGIMAFEHLLVSKLNMGWEVVPFVSRVIISSEIITGLGLLIDSSNRKFYTIISLLLLTSFTFYLLFDLVTVGNSNNCGCFGEVLPLNTIHSILKNVIFIALATILFLVLDGKLIKLYKNVVLVTVLSLSIIFIAKPMAKYQVIKSAKNEEVSIDSNLVKKDTPKVNKLSEEKKEEAKKDTNNNQKKDILKNSATKFKPHESGFAQFGMKSRTSVNIDTGEKIVALFSLDCEHCQAAAKSFAAQKSKFNLPEVLILFFGEQEQVEPFFNQAGSSFNYLIIEPEVFFPLLKKSPPRVFYLINGNIVGDWEGDLFNIEILKKEILKNRE